MDGNQNVEKVTQTTKCSKLSSDTTTITFLTVFIYKPSSDYKEV